MTRAQRLRRSNPSDSVFSPVSPTRQDERHGFSPRLASLSHGITTLSPSLRTGHHVGAFQLIEETQGPDAAPKPDQPSIDSLPTTASSHEHAFGDYLDRVNPAAVSPSILAAVESHHKAPLAPLGLPPIFQFAHTKGIQTDSAKSTLFKLGATSEFRECYH
jgi:hypothetical protein